MPERTFGRTIRYRRTKLGLSQAKLGELVGRSTSTIRSWERDKSHPRDPDVINALSAVLGVDEQQLFDRAGQVMPEVEESPTIEQALATLNPEPEQTILLDEPDFEEETPEEPEPEEKGQDFVVDLAPIRSTSEPTTDESTEPEAPTYSSPPNPLLITAPTPPVHEPSYMEDRSQRQMYRVRNLATIVVLVGLGIAFLWALTNGLSAFGDWWDDFFGNLNL